MLLAAACAEGGGGAASEAVYGERAAEPRTGPSAGGVRPDAGAAEVRRTVLFLGNSLTAGFGLPERQAFPALIQQRIDSAGLAWRVVPAGLSGETSAGGLRRVAWYLDEPVHVLVLELGANDMLRGHDLAVTKRNLQGIIDRVRAHNPAVEVVIAGMRAPPNLGRAYAGRFEAMYRELAEENDAALIPFLLDGVAADATLNLEDGIHPNAEGHRRLADNVWAVLERVLREGAIANEA